MQIETAIEFEVEYAHRLHPELKGRCGACICYGAVYTELAALARELSEVGQ